MIKSNVHCISLLVFSFYCLICGSVAFPMGNTCSVVHKHTLYTFVCLQVFSIVVFGCIASIPNVTTVCPYYYTSSACDFGIAAGVISFLGLMVFLVTDALFDNLSNIQQRKYIVLADVTFSCKITLYLMYITVERVTDE